MTQPHTLKMPLVFTSEVNMNVADDTEFAKFVLKSIQRFFANDWGECCENDKKQNDIDNENLKKGDYGRVLASYINPTNVFKNPLDRVWIVKDSQAITVLFPHEY